MNRKLKQVNQKLKQVNRKLKPENRQLNQLNQSEWAVCLLQSKREVGGNILFKIMAREGGGSDFLRRWSEGVPDLIPYEDTLKVISHST